MLDFGVEVQHFKGAGRVILLGPLGQETMILKKRKLRFAHRFPIAADTGRCIGTPELINAFKRSLATHIM